MSPPPMAARPLPPDAPPRPTWRPRSYAVAAALVVAAGLTAPREARAETELQAWAGGPMLTYTARPQGDDLLAGIIATNIFFSR